MIMILDQSVMKADWSYFFELYGGVKVHFCSIPHGGVGTGDIKGGIPLL